LIYVFFGKAREIKMFGKAWRKDVGCMFIGHQWDDAITRQVVDCSYDKI
jgi:hypothetical protein